MWRPGGSLSRRRITGCWLGRSKVTEVTNAVENAGLPSFVGWKFHPPSRCSRFSSGAVSSPDAASGSSSAALLPAGASPAPEAEASDAERRAPVSADAGSLASAMSGPVAAGSVAAGSVAAGSVAAGSVAAGSVPEGPNAAGSVVVTECSAAARWPRCQSLRGTPGLPIRHTTRKEEGFQPPA